MLQKNNDWFEKRRGKFTSSEIHKLLTEPKLKKEKEAGEFSQTAKTFIMEKVCEEFGALKKNFSNAYTEHGDEYESEARDKFIEATNYKVVETDFIDNGEDGGSPDGLIMDRNNNIISGIEIKCPYVPVNHLNNFNIINKETFKKYRSEYYWQTQHLMSLTSTNFWYFISYSPDFYDTWKFHYALILRDYQDTEYIKEIIQKASLYKKNLINKFNNGREEES